MATQLTIGNIYYKLFGPTTVHLEHEISLIITTSFLTSASLISVYRLSFPTAGDLLYIWISILWLSLFSANFLATLNVHVIGRNIDEIWIMQKLFEFQKSVIHNRKPVCIQQL